MRRRRRPLISRVPHMAPWRARRLPSQYGKSSLWGARPLLPLPTVESDPHVTYMCPKALIKTSPESLYTTSYEHKQTDTFACGPRAHFACVHGALAGRRRAAIAHDEVAAPQTHNFPVSPGLDASDGI